ncbi:LytTR family DNA-binding domain-containing protein [Shewanella khirikhana]|uniref:LytR/AlgR family response regulator transcription factor n=1 Tax=Shewanella khirikhana TaxID=1965282 RepID=UPI0030D2D4CE
MLKALIVEDSRLARVELKQQLAAIEGITVVAEAASVQEGISACEAHAPDLLFLDIDLPDGSGFELLASLDEAPRVIFTTAFEEFALQAFEKQALDYLLKPISSQRLQQACERAMLAIESANRSEKMTLDSQFFVKDGRNCYLVRLGDVERFEAQGNYTQVYFDDNKPLIYRTLNKIEPRLPGQHFFRVSRQHIVQLAHIRHIEACSSGGLELTLSSGARIEVSRRQTSLLRDLMSL